jgi:outer membrane protein OmpA-like peptidoglycan-associated protein
MMAGAFMILIKSISFVLLASSLLHAQAPDRTSAKAITEALTLRPKAMDVRPSIALKVPFAFNSAVLTPEGKAQLDELARALQSPELAGKHFALNGHTDAIGQPAYNLKLSNLRAGAVQAYLVSRYGINRALLETKGFGATKLLLPNEPTNEQNRRVEVEALD